MTPQLAQSITVTRITDGQRDGRFRFAGGFPEVVAMAVNRVVLLGWDIDSLVATVDGVGVSLAFRERVRQEVIRRQGEVLDLGVIPDDLLPLREVLK